MKIPVQENTYGKIVNVELHVCEETTCIAAESKLDEHVTTVSHTFKKQAVLGSMYYRQQEIFIQTNTAKREQTLQCTLSLQLSDHETSIRSTHGEMSFVVYSYNISVISVGCNVLRSRVHHLLDAIVTNTMLWLSTTGHLICIELTYPV